MNPTMLRVGVRQIAAPLLVALLSAWVGALAAGLAIPTVYYPTAVVQVANSQAVLGLDNSLDHIGGVAQAPTYARLARSLPVLRAALGPAGRPDLLQQRVTAEVIPGTNLIKIGVYDRDGATGATLANAIAAALIDDAEAGRAAGATANLSALQVRIGDLDAQATALSGRVAGGDQRDLDRLTRVARSLNELRAAYAYYETLGLINAGRPLLRRVETALPPAEPISTASPLTWLLISGVALVVALAGLGLLERLDQQIRDAEDAGRATGLPVLGRVPRA